MGMKIFPKENMYEKHTYFVVFKDPDNFEIF